MFRQCKCSIVNAVTYDKPFLFPCCRFVPQAQIPESMYNAEFGTTPDGYEMFSGSDRLFLVAACLGLPWVGACPKTRQLLPSVL